MAELSTLTEGPRRIGVAPCFASESCIMDLHSWMADEMNDMRGRLQSSVLDLIPLERHKEQVDNGGSTITSLVWHIARHQDIAINGVLLGEPLVHDSYVDRCNSGGLHPADGLAETESQEITAVLDPAGVIAYYDAVCEHTSRHLSAGTFGDLDRLPDSGAALEAAGVNRDNVPWLFNMWEAKPASFHVRWEAISHGVTHTGEMVSMRNRMGLSPF